jgi:ribonuclease R
MELDRRSVLALFHGSIQRPVSPREMAQLLAIDRDGELRLQAVLRSLTETGDLVRIKGGRFGLPRKLNLVVGRLRCTPKGYGFVVAEKGQSADVFVRAPNMGGALHDDRVVARVEHRKPDGRLEGAIIRVLEHAHRRLIGTYEAGVNYGRVVPLEAKILTDVVVAPDQAQGARDGQIVEVAIDEYPGRIREATGRVVELLGWPQEPGIDLELVLRRHELPRAFPAAVRRAARAVAVPVGPGEVEGRTDFRGDLVVTIDGEKARDFDDAVSVARLGDGGFRLQVHIADVSHYVAPGGDLDAEARRRGTSVYFPDHVIPMLPEELSNDICSLMPGVDRLTMSLVVDLDDGGEVVDYHFHRGVIRSAERLTYEVVHRYLVERDAGLRARYRHLGDLLETLWDVARRLGQRRRERGSLDFDLPESEIVLDLAGEMTGIRRGERLRSHDIIEELMILANETVARHFLEEDLPFLYRVHEPPSPPDVDELNQTLALFGAEVDALSPKSFRVLLERVRGRPEERFVHTVALRTMKLARYQPVNIGHFGLASGAYCHFTSPIRRYPDLVVHRLLREAMADTELGGARRRSMRGELDVVASDCSRLERRAEEAEREYVERKKARFMADKVGERFSAVITAVEAFGFFVELEEYFVEGLVHLTSLHDDYYQHDEAGHRLVGDATGRTFRLGDRLQVEVSHVDLLRRQVDFVVAEAAAEPGPARRRRGRGRRPS